MTATNICSNFGGKWDSPPLSQWLIFILGKDSSGVCDIVLQLTALVLMIFLCARMRARHMSYTAAFKLKAIVFAEKLRNRRAERVYRVSEKLVWDWRKKNIKLTTLPRSARSHRVMV